MAIRRLDRGVIWLRRLGIHEMWDEMVMLSDEMRWRFLSYEKNFTFLIKEFTAQPTHIRFTKENTA